MTRVPELWVTCRIVPWRAGVVYLALVASLAAVAAASPSSPERATAVSAPGTRFPKVWGTTSTSTTIAPPISAPPVAQEDPAPVVEAPVVHEAPTAVSAAPAATGGGWDALRECESGNNYADSDSSTYRGAYQFDAGTWASVGGSGDPADASPAEQDARAQRLYAERGTAPWPNCGRHLG